VKKTYSTKRIFDIVSSLVLLTPTFPVFLVVALAIRLTSSGPAIFRQKRLGHHGTTFIIFKFRSMKIGTGKELDQVTPDDPRITKVGKFLRSTHLDELPQLFNVVRGEMSMVGPRPEEVSIAEYLKEKVPGYAERLEMMPGVTGLSQIAGREKVNQLGRKYEVRLDQHYGRKQSIRYDLKVMLGTVPHILRFKGV